MDTKEPYDKRKRIGFAAHTASARRQSNGRGEDPRPQALEGPARGHTRAQARAAGRGSGRKATLFVIEAPGKTVALASALTQLGERNPRIFATCGHLYAMPRALDPLGIGEGLLETLRRPVDAERIAKLNQAAASAAEVIVMTDADEEGEAIALDVACLVARTSQNAPRVRRAPLTGLDPASVERAILARRPIEAAAAAPARSRAIVDRLIGATFSRAGVSVGRVSTALLGAIAARPPVLGEMRFRLPAADGGTPFLARIAVRSLDQACQMARLAAQPLPRVEARAEQPVPGAVRPWHFGELLVAARLETGMPVEEIAETLQELYEDARLSYPRSAERGLGGEARKAVAALARQEGLPADPALLPDRVAGSSQEAPHPLLDGARLPGLKLRGRVEQLDRHGALLTLVARRLIEAAQNPIYQLPETRDLPEWARGLPWSRRAGRRLPWEIPPGPGFLAYPADVIALKALMDNGLGRPSTWAGHASRFVRRELVTQDFRLSRKGHRWLGLAPDALHDPELARDIEEALDLAGLAGGRSSGDAGGRRGSSGATPFEELCLPSPDTPCSADGIGTPAMAAFWAEAAERALALLPEDAWEDCGRAIEQETRRSLSAYRRGAQRAQAGRENDDADAQGPVPEALERRQDGPEVR